MAAPHINVEVLNMLPIMKRVGWILLATAITCFPAAIYLQRELNAPIWYHILLGISGALGVGAFSIFFGGIALIAGRDKPNGGLRVAIITTIIAGLASSYFALYPSFHQ
jgi:hypothetical protein